YRRGHWRTEISQDGDFLNVSQALLFLCRREERQRAQFFLELLLPRPVRKHKDRNSLAAQGPALSCPQNHIVGADQLSANPNQLIAIRDGDRLIFVVAHGPQASHAIEISGQQVFGVRAESYTKEKL